MRRETWMQDKSREIKELTVKGLQPEIERLLSKHKKELQRMEEANAIELKRQRHVRACCCVRCSWTACLASMLPRQARAMS